ncbi:MAG: hypothetical protein JXR58_00785 [Bacteroidales bacterium]|nr:hypothetical protein [Bacteroidales bacterium]
MKYNFVITVIVLLLSLSFRGLAQQDTVKSDTATLEPDFRYLLMDDETEVEYPVFKPVIGLGYGIITFRGDVNDIYNGSPMVGRTAFNFSVARRLSKNVNVNFQGINGKLTGNERGPDRYLNFKTDFLNIGVNFEYNFRHLIIKPTPVIPFLSLGLESFSFNSKADMYDANGNLYHFWSDGSIRNIAENPLTAHTSTILQRDYNYETDVRELDLDGLGKYNQTAFGLPISLGADMKVTDRVSIRMAVTYHMLFNDLIDNVSEVGTGIRQGNSANDKFWYSHVSLRLDLFSPPKMTILDIHYQGIDFIALDLEDEDNDHVRDIDDNCPGTPPGIKVTDKGCPIDTDNDGIPDYLDLEKNSAPKAIVNTKGVTMTDDEIIALGSRPGVLRSEMYDYYPSMRGTKGFITFYLEIPEKFKHLDINDNERVDLDELMQAIDDFFDMKSKLSLEEIYELNDFFFDQ